MNLTKDQLKAILDAVFGELEKFVAGKRWLPVAVEALHAVATSDAVLSNIVALIGPKQ